MDLRRQLKLRFARGFGIRSLGPNEARLLFDTVASTAGIVVSIVFVLSFVQQADPRRVVVSVLLPPILLATNFAFGVYTRLKRASGTRKSVALTSAVAISAGLGGLAGIPGPIAILWAVLTITPLVLARLLLNLPYSRHKDLAAVAVTLRGPVLVIGGAGYIGSHVVDQLLKSGESVRVLDNLMYGSDSLRESQNHPNFELIQGDATDIRKITAAMKGASAVIHLAGLVGDPACALDPDFTHHTNIAATRLAKDVAESLGVHRFIFASSCSVYGINKEQVDQLAPLNPVSLYAQTKIDSERELLAACRDDFFVTVLRFATVFGHSRRPRFDLVANLFTAQAVTDGAITVIGPHQRRPFVHVRDLARAIVMVLKAPPATVQGQVFNIGDSRLNATILQLAETVQRVVSSTREVSISVRDDPTDRRNYEVSFRKVNEVLGFTADTSLEEGIREMVREFQLGRYQHYRDAIYSNLAVTRQTVEDGYDPFELMHIYAPLRIN